MEYTSTIVIAEDQKIFREALVKELHLLGVNTLAEAANGEDLINLLKLHTPDVVLLDTEMPVMDGIKTMKAIGENYPGIKVIILSAHSEQTIINDFVQLGANGYLVKDVVSGNMDLLVEAINKVKVGIVPVIETPASSFTFLNKKAELTAAEKEGKTNEQLAAEMGITLHDSELGNLKPNDKNSLEKASGFFKHTFGKGLDFLLDDEKKK